MTQEPQVTVVDVPREIGIEPTPDLTWSVGPKVRNIWEEETGAPPGHDLRNKTNGGGSHFFAVYPASFKPRIMEVIRAHWTQAAKQSAFDFGGVKG
jgi:hypothetical protein